MRRHQPLLNVPPMNPPPMPLIGPIAPDEGMGAQNVLAEADSQEDVSSSHNQRNQRARDQTNRRERDRNVAERRRSRSRERHDRDRHDRGRRERRSRERRTKWGDANEPQLNQSVIGVQMMPMSGQPMPGIMPFMNMVGHQPTDSAIHGLAAMNMMPNIAQNMMMMNPQIDQNMMMMNQQIMPSQQMSNQPIYTSGGIFLPPIPGVSTPARRQRPNGCRTIFVGGLPHNITEETLNEIFQRFGDVTEIKTARRGVFHVRFERQESVEQSFSVSGYRFRFHDQVDREATTMFIDYALNRDDQMDYERNSHDRAQSPQRVEPFTTSALAAITDKIKNESEFPKVAPTLASWLERGECNKKNANSFYSLIQASNNQIRRLFNEKMQLDEDFMNMKTAMKEKFTVVIKQFEAVAKILSAAKHQRVSDHFTKQQRRNIDMWMKMTEELDNLKEEFNAMFDEEEIERPSKNMVSLEKYEDLKRENENLTYELEGYKNEAYLAKDEAERKFETFKAHFIAQQALQNKEVYSHSHMMGTMDLQKHKVETITSASSEVAKPSPTVKETKLNVDAIVPLSDAKLISILTAFLMVHPLGASLDYLVSYVKSMAPEVTQATVLSTLQKYNDVFASKSTGVGASIENKWSFVTFDSIKS
ncbi:ecto-NOX disulfide-thiol exchanger 2-like [Aricia agestis]|uniref:ecto-NOX disulfide-thiol exchanger 2-like n=1 Tax=Aricia agestis TaxID=91739 RepID=UPI001C20AD44|nr:ecto-NOX disulfide-thiol exchanger 2-like [Aricia agestis]